MDVIKLSMERHSVRQYVDKRIESEKRDALIAAAKKINEKSGLRFELFFDEKEGFDSAFAGYGRFENVFNYVAIFGKKGKEEAVGFYGEELVLLAQELGLNTCWVALTFNKGKVKQSAQQGEKLYMVIALGYGKTQGVQSKSKTPKDVLTLKGEPVKGLSEGVECALLAPTAVNQQKFKIICENGNVSVVKSGIGFYTDVDLGIVKYHFEKASGIKVFNE